MAAAARQPKPPRKGVAETASRRPSAWTGARASPTYSPAMGNARLPGGPQPPAGGSFPPLAPSNGTPKQDRPLDRVLQQLSGLTGTTITLVTKSTQRYEGVIASTGGEGDTLGVTLKDVKEISNPGQPLKESLFIASANIDTWSSGPADAKLTNGDSFKTDTDISQKAPRSERPLQAWADDIPENTTASGRFNADDVTFGPGASQTGNQWDQFSANEKLFGVKTTFDEDAYTTKLDRNAPDFKEKEKKAQAVANEILSGVANNPHIAEERVMNFTGENGVNEEEKYSTVIRSANAYVPPGARRGGNGVVTPTSAGQPKADVPKVAVNGPDGSPVKEAQKPASPVPAGAAAPNSSADPVPAFRNFVSTERDRLLKKKQALMKNEMDKRMAELVKFSQTFKLNKPIPEDLVTILAKDEEKQKQIREKSSQDAVSTQARAIGPTTLTAGAPINASASTARIPGAPGITKVPGSGSPQPGASGKPTALVKTSSSNSQSNKDAAAKRVSMIIQPIPPFKGKRVAPSAAPGAGPTSAAQPPTIRTQSNANGNSANTPLSPTAVNRLNVNASSFRPTQKTPAGPGNGNASASPKPKPSEASAVQGPPNPFFGTRVLKKGPPIKDDFNPFKHAKVVDASQISQNWPYSGKRFMSAFPPMQTPPQQQSPHMAPPGPPPQMPPPAFEDPSDPAAQAAQAAARGGYVYAYAPYGYPGQPMMPGMPPPPGHMPYMQPIPYPYMHPPAMYPGTPMGQMPPPQFMPPPPPGSYPPPPNGAGPRPSMPPTPIPSHAHPYYHQSPQLQHAVPYQMMMPPPGAPHPYDGAPAPPVQMGGHA